MASRIYSLGTPGTMPSSMHDEPRIVEGAKHVQNEKRSAFSSHLQKVADRIQDLDELPLLQIGSGGAPGD